MSNEKSRLSTTSSGFVSVDSFAKLDTDRVKRRGLPEVILCERKTPSEVRELVLELAKHTDVVLGTRANLEHYQAVCDIPGIEYHERARIIRLTKHTIQATATGLITVFSAGTSDIPVAQEAAITAHSFGSRVETIFDVGVAGIHRILSYRTEIENSNALVVVAGMDGALPSVVGGLARCPVIAVPTSTGYGASFGGVAALLSMLNSCSPGISVVNIDNGFGAGYQAHVINAQSAPKAIHAKELASAAV
jgi:NCAIR mutase (PurE)-related protein